MPVSWRPIVLLAISTTLLVRPAFAQTIEPNRPYRGHYTICASKEGAIAARNAFQELADRLVANAASTDSSDPGDEWSHLFERVPDCASGIFEIVPFQAEPAWAGSRSVYPKFDPSSTDVAIAHADGHEWKIPVRFAVGMPVWYYAYYVQPNGKRIIVLAQIFPENIWEEWQASQQRSNAP